MNPIKNPIILLIFLILLLQSCGSNKISENNQLTSQLPKPIGPYSIYRVSGNTVYISGQIALNNENILVNNNFNDEVRQVMNNIQTILLGLNLDFKNIVQTTVYLKDLNNFQEFNTIYGSYFTDGMFPSRVTVEVSKLPKNANIEISCIATIE